MVKIEALIQPFKLDDVKAALEGLRVGVTLISEVVGHGVPGSHKAYYRGAEYDVDVPMVKLEMLVSSERADEIIDAILRVARTSVPGDDGTILVYEVADAIQIRTGARLQYTLT
jgi:nitrogen regulatory protein P-II 1